MGPTGQSWLIHRRRRRRFNFVEILQFSFWLLYRFLNKPQKMKWVKIKKVEKSQAWQQLSEIACEAKCVLTIERDTQNLYAQEHWRGHPKRNCVDQQNRIKIIFRLRLDAPPPRGGWPRGRPPRAQWSYAPGGAPLGILLGSKAKCDSTYRKVLDVGFVNFGAKIVFFM